MQNACRHDAADGGDDGAGGRGDGVGDGHGEGDASDNVGVVGVQFKLDGANLGAEDTTTPYDVVVEHDAGGERVSGTLTATARDAAGNQTTSAAR